MAYQSGTNLADITELLNQLRTFLTSNGYTQHEFNQNAIDWTGTLGTSTTLVVSKNSNYFYFWTDLIGLSGGSWGDNAKASLFMKIGTGYTPGNDPFSHPGTWGETFQNGHNNGTILNFCGTSTIQRYHFFMENEEITVVFQTSTGWWRTFSFGVVNSKLTTFTGGAYTMGDYIYSWSDAGQDSQNIVSHRYFDKAHSTYGSIITGGSVLRADFDATPQYHHGGYVQYLGQNELSDPTGGDCSSGEITHAYANLAPYFLIEGCRLLRGSNNYGLISHTQPLNIWLRRTGDRAMLTARIDSILLTNISHFAAEQEVVIGADTWVIFPTSVKTTGQTVAGVPGSWVYGHAIKKVI